MRRADRQRKPVARVPTADVAAVQGLIPALSSAMSSQQQREKTNTTNANNNRAHPSNAPSTKEVQKPTLAPTTLSARNVDGNEYRNTIDRLERKMMVRMNELDQANARRAAAFARREKAIKKKEAIKSKLLQAKEHFLEALQELQGDLFDLQLMNTKVLEDEYGYQGVDVGGENMIGDKSKGSEDEESTSFDDEFEADSDARRDRANITTITTADSPHSILSTRYSQRPQISAESYRDIHHVHYSSSSHNSLDHIFQRSGGGGGGGAEFEGGRDIEETGAVDEAEDGDIHFWEDSEDTVSATAASGGGTANGSLRSLWANIGE